MKQSQESVQENMLDAATLHFVHWTNSR